MTHTVSVEAPARLHFGVLDLRGSLGRWFGGVGAAAPGPTLLLSASPAARLDVTGEDADRAAEFARLFLTHHRVPGGASICVQRALPRHSGLGSGTQLALAVARALAGLYGLDTDAPALATATGRARRSAIGTWTFAGGGLVLEGGRHREAHGIAPLLARLPFPLSWRCVVAVPAGPPGISGAEEASAFSQLPVPPEREVEKIAHLVLMALLPSLADADLLRFGSALTAIQQITGGWFDSVQGGTFTPGASANLIQAMTEWGVPGVGQSSWGPAVYGIVEGSDASARLAARIGEMVGSGGQVYEGPFRTEGARVWLGST
jgi:beta-ribofuranosylaminobenzene 5'-phosphate synthase